MARNYGLAGVVQHHHLKIAFAMPFMLGAHQRYRQQGQVRTRRPDLAGTQLGIDPISASLILQRLALRVAGVDLLKPCWQLLPTVIGQCRYAHEQRAKRDGE